jgi:hypothetical protein
MRISFVVAKKRVLFTTNILLSKVINFYFQVIRRTLLTLGVTGTALCAAGIYHWHKATTVAEKF